MLFCYLVLSQTISRFRTVPSSLQGPSSKQVKCKHSIFEEQGEEFICVDTGFTFFFLQEWPFFMLMRFVLSLSVLFCIHWERNQCTILLQKPFWHTKWQESWPNAVCLQSFPGVPRAATALLLSRGEARKLAGDREVKISSRWVGSWALSDTSSVSQHHALVAFFWTFHFWYSQIPSVSFLLWYLCPVLSVPDPL